MRAVTMTVLKWIIIAAAVLNFGFMAFDGARGIILGDYLRPQTGEYAGQLGPWSKLIEAVGIDPESTTMKLIFVLWGVTGLTITFCYAFNIAWAWPALLIISIATLWYLVPGTALSVLQVLLLLIIRYFK